MTDAETKVLDASHWVRPVWGDWKEKGYVGTYLKVSEGDRWEDNFWKQHYDGAADYYKGPYHYFHGYRNGAIQAGWFWGKAGVREWDMRPVIDVEKYSGNVKADGSRTVSRTVFAARLRNCLFETEKLWGVRPMIYTSRHMWSFLVGSTSWASAYDLWTAHYTSYPVPLIPDDWKGKGYRMWQWIDRPIDQNRFHGDLAAFLKWMGEEPPVTIPVYEVLQPGLYKVE